MKILVLGNGMYSTGRGTSGYGTILPSLVEYQRQYKNINEIIIVGSNYINSKLASIKIKKLLNITKVSIKFDCFPKKKNDLYAYKKIINTNKQPCCAIISVPDHLHFELAKYCLEKKIHVLVVKPLAPTINECKKLIEIAKKNKVLNLVEFHKRFDKQNIIIKNKLNTNEIGELLYTWTEYSQRKSIPMKIFKKWAHKSNILQYLGIHYIDLIFFLTEARPIKVMAIGQKKYLYKKGINTFDSIQCIIQWKMKNGNLFTQTLLVNWIDSEFSTSVSDQKIFLVGTNGKINANQKDRGLTYLTDNKKLETINPDFCTLFKNNKFFEHRGYGIESILNFLKNVDLVINNKKSIKKIMDNQASFSEALISTAVIEYANKSLANSSKWLNIPLIK